MKKKKNVIASILLFFFDYTYLVTKCFLSYQESISPDGNMTEIEQPPPQTNGIDNDEDENSKVRPADIEAVC